MNDVLNVYIKEIKGEDVFDVYPERRNKEIKKIKNTKVRKQKYEVWKLLEFALKDSFNIDINDITFHKSKMGRWYCDNIYFSLSHADGIVMVGISNNPVGVDIENKRKMSNARIHKIKEMICLEKEKKDNFYEIWTKKESIFKYIGKGNYIPKNINTHEYDCYTNKYKDYTYSVCGNIGDMNIYTN